MKLTPPPEGLSWQLLTDSSIYEARTALQSSVMELLGICSEQLNEVLLHYSTLPTELLESRPKITRGENYQGSPWMVLDYPKVFNKDGIIALRVLVRFGDAVHCTFPVSGTYLQNFREKFIRAGKSGSYSEYPVSCEGSPWIHHLEKDTFKPIHLLESELKHCSFIKPGTTIPFSEWNKIPERVTQFFGKTAMLLCS